jgi:hypothetical protein
MSREIDRVDRETALEERGPELGVPSCVIAQPMEDTDPAALLVPAQAPARDRAAACEGDLVRGRSQDRRFPVQVRLLTMVSRVGAQPNGGPQHLSQA